MKKSMGVREKEVLIVLVMVLSSANLEWYGTRGEMIHYHTIMQGTYHKTPFTCSKKHFLKVKVHS